MKQTLLQGLGEMGMTLSGAQVDTLCAFGTALLEKNQVMNLTAITDPVEVARLHFLDCIALLQATQFAGKRMIDVGCGAGFPGVPLKIAQPELELTLLDSLGKRMVWLGEVLPQLGVDAECLTARAEDAAAERREQYDIATARAVARLPILCELCLPFVKVGGVFVAMKGADAAQEAKEAYTAIKTLGGKLEQILEYPIPGTDAVHRAVVIRKERPTPAKYPRRYAKIKQNPL